MMICGKKVMFLLGVGLFYLLSFRPQTVCADDYVDRLKYNAQKYYWGVEEKKDLAKALDLYLKAAERGDNESKYIAGGMYFKGLGTTRDLGKAFSLLYGAALEGKSTPQSQKLLGQFFLTGTATPKNYGEALKWYSLAAENGDRDAQSELAFLYFTGRGGERDLEKSFYWYRMSANKGLAVAQYSLGIMYYTGNGTENVDMTKAYGWLSLAAAQNHLEAIQARDYIESSFDPDELQAAQKFATELFSRVNR